MEAPVIAAAAVSGVCFKVAMLAMFLPVIRFSVMLFCFFQCRNREITSNNPCNLGVSITQIAHLERPVLSFSTSLALMSCHYKPSQKIQSCYMQIILSILLLSFQHCSNARKYPQLAIVGKLALTCMLPASSTVSERSFSALRHVKAHTRASTGQNRLNSLTRIHVHREHSDEIDRQAIIRDFVQCHPYRSERAAVQRQMVSCIFYHLI